MEKQSQNRLVLILGAVGGALLLAGVIFAIVGCIDLISAIRAQISPRNLWCVFLAFPLLGVGGGFFAFSLKATANNSNTQTKKPPEA